MSQACAAWRGDIGAYVVGALSPQAGARGATSPGDLPGLQGRLPGPGARPRLAGTRGAAGRRI